MYPDIALRILRVPVDRVLDDLPLCPRSITNYPRGDAVGQLLGGGCGDDDDVLWIAARLHAAIGPPGARLHRPVRIGDIGTEAGRIQVDRTAPLGSLDTADGLVPGGLSTAGSLEEFAADGAFGMLAQLTHVSAAEMVMSSKTARVFMASSLVVCGEVSSQSSADLLSARHLYNHDQEDAPARRLVRVNTADLTASLVVCIAYLLIKGPLRLAHFCSLAIPSRSVQSGPARNLLRLK
jgi:hypothetical protein